MNVRTRLFNKENPEGRLFLTQEEVDQAMISGWVDAKHKVGSEPKILANFVTEMPPAPKIKEKMNLCECGCGTPVKNRFVQGHSWKAVKKNVNRKDSQPADSGNTL
jgi:hypothetical protein